jgi:PPOX class probable F420-dependent enzyme
MALEEPVQALLRAKNFVHVATLHKDGTPHVVPVWVDTDGEDVIVNSAEGRAWVRHLERDPRITCTVMNMENPYEYAIIRGRMTTKTTDGADDHIDALAKKYLDADSYPFRQEGEQRIKYVVDADRVRHSKQG